LKEGIPNLLDLDKIYKLLKLITDVSIEGNSEEAKLFIINSKKAKGKSCDIFLNYLENIIKN
jgi:hypothetical protein